MRRLLALAAIVAAAATIQAQGTGAKGAKGRKVAVKTAAATAQQSGLTGFATYADMGLRGTTGGAMGEVVRVTTREELERYVGDSTPRVVIIANDMTGRGVDDVRDEVQVGSNKTIIGAGKGVTLSGICLNANGQHNIILRNITVTKGKPDAIAMRDTHHIWIDHCDLSSCDDGLLDLTVGSSYMTVSWTRFHDHDKTTLCNSGTGHFEDNGRERATYHHCAFVNTVQRNPRVGYGLGHVFNNYYEGNSGYCVGYHTGAAMVVENSYFNNTTKPFSQMYTADPASPYYADALSLGNVFHNVKGDTLGTGRGFATARYYDHAFAMHPATDVPQMQGAVGPVSGIERDIIPFPGNGATGITAATRLSCGAIEGATAYSFSLGTEKTSLHSLSSLPLRGKSEGANSSPSLQAATTYYWQAVATTPRGKVKSGVFRFTTASAKAAWPTPADGDMAARLREAYDETSPCRPLALRWSEAFDAARYIVYLSDRGDITAADIIGTTAATEITPRQRLLYGKQYRWRVDAVTAKGDTVQGDVWTFSSPQCRATVGRTELEHAVRNGRAFVNAPGAYFKCSNDSIAMGEAGPGSLSVIWAGKKGIYDISTTCFDENDGQSRYLLYVNETQRDEWRADRDTESLQTHATKGIMLRPGDEIRIEFQTHRKEQCRTDCIDITPAW